MMKPPFKVCPKCGFNHFAAGREVLVHYGVIRANNTTIEEWLEWTCWKCSYTQRTKTADHPDAGG